MAEVPKVCLTALPELKNTTDDNVAPILNSHGYTQNHTLTDVRLALGFLGCIIAGTTFYFDFKLGFEATKSATLWAVIAYFAINSALTLWIWGVEKGTVYVGTNKKEGVTVKVSSSSKKFDPTWYYTIVKEGKGKKEVVEGKAAFMQWFDEKGFFVRQPLETLLLSEIAGAKKEK